MQEGLIKEVPGESSRGQSKAREEPSKAMMDLWFQV